MLHVYKDSVRRECCVIVLTESVTRTVTVARIGKLGIVSLRSFLKCLYGYTCVSVGVSRNHSGYAVDASASSVIYSGLRVFQ